MYFYNCFNHFTNILKFNAYIIEMPNNFCAKKDVM